MRLLTLFSLLFVALQTYGKELNTQIAFIPDVHFHDIYADFRQSGFKGVKLDSQTKPVAIRSMKAQLHSTRLFNENYFALIAALNDIAERGVKLVALPGDFTDDGQPAHLKGLKALLNDYTKRYDMRFFAIPGNHDPVKPIKTAAGKSDFLNDEGREVAIFSRDHKNCKASQTDTLFCDDGIAHGGYQEIVTAMADFGLMPSSQDLLWQTPFTSDHAALSERQYQQCSEDKQHCVMLPDTSYLVEPVAGLWLLAIDANVYLPEFKNNQLTFKGSGNAGYNKVLTEKPYLITWIKQIVSAAKKQNKTLIAFSHFPMGEFYDQQSASIKELYGSDAFQLTREPTSNTQETLAETGLRLHIGGHMHMNDTSLIKTAKNTLYNIQAPSISAYRPAYKLVSIIGSKAKVDTVLLDSIAGFDTLFPAYEKEYSYLAEHNPDEKWLADILDSEDYHQFTLRHLAGLTRWRFIPREWPESFRSVLLSFSFHELLGLYDSPINKPLTQHSERALKGVTLFEFIRDFYLLRNAGTLAFEDIPTTHLKAYKVMAQQLNTMGQCIPKDVGKIAQTVDVCTLQIGLSKALMIFEKLADGENDRCLMIDLNLNANKPAKACRP